MQHTVSTRFTQLDFRQWFPHGHAEYTRFSHRYAPPNNVAVLCVDEAFATLGAARVETRLSILTLGVTNFHKELLLWIHLPRLQYQACELTGSVARGLERGSGTQGGACSRDGKWQFCSVVIIT